MGTIAIGDIHGNALALDDLLTRLRAEAAADDTVVFLGDYIDRGPDSKACIERILEWRGARPAPVVCLLGNHEDWLLWSLGHPTEHSWLLGMDGFTTIRSYSRPLEETFRQAVQQATDAVYAGTQPLPYDRLVEAMPPAHRDFLDSLVLYHRDAHAIYVHAGVDGSVPLEAQTRRTLLSGWGDGFPHRYDGDELVVYGHRNNAVVDADGWPRPRIGSRTVGLDTSLHGVVTAIRLPDRRVFQSGRYDLASS